MKVIQHGLQVGWQLLTNLSHMVSILKMRKCKSMLFQRARQTVVELVKTSWKDGQARLPGTKAQRREVLVGQATTSIHAELYYT